MSCKNRRTQKARTEHKHKREGSLPNDRGREHGWSTAAQGNTSVGVCGVRWISMGSNLLTNNDDILIISV